MNRSLNGFRCIGFAYKNHRDLFENESADGDCGPWAVGGELAGLMAGDEEYRSRGEREYARCRIAEYSLLRIAGVSLRGRRWEGVSAEY